MSDRKDLFIRERIKFEIFLCVPCKTIQSPPRSWSLLWLHTHTHTHTQTVEFTTFVVVTGEPIRLLPSRYLLLLSSFHPPDNQHLLFN